MRLYCSAISSVLISRINTGGIARSAWPRLTVPTRMASITAVFLLTAEIGVTHVCLRFFMMIQTKTLCVSCIDALLCLSPG